MAAASATSRVVSVRPAVERRVAAGEVEAGLADVAPGRGASRMVIFAPSALVSSWITIASAPIGSGPPVKMRTASPGFSA